MRPIVSAVIVVALATAGCMNVGIDTGENLPQNEGANADVGDTLYVRNAFLLSGADRASPAPQLALYAVLVNNSHQPAQLERITAEGGASVQLSGPITLPPNQPVGTGNRPIGTVSGVRGGSGTTVPMTFVFKGSEPARLNVPIKARTGHYTDLTPSPAGSPTPSPAGTAPPTPSPTR
jgi:copper(I)-binding protein